MNMKGRIKSGIRVMVMRGHLEQDTMEFVGTRGTVFAVYSKDPVKKDRNEFCIAVKLDSRNRHDLPMLFRASDLANINVNGRI
jgi:hypothetical protein